MLRTWLLVPLVVGLVQPVLWQMNLRVARATGDMESAIVLHAVGTGVGVAWLWSGMRGRGWDGLGSVPWWAWLAGAIGVTGLAALNRSMPHTGVASGLALMVAAQLVAALLFEHFGWMGAQLRIAGPERWAGVALLAVGAWLVSR